MDTASSCTKKVILLFRLILLKRKHYKEKIVLNIALISI